MGMFTDFTEFPGSYDLLDLDQQVVSLTKSPNIIIKE
jgi:hypothetical protein